MKAWQLIGAACSALALGACDAAPRADCEEKPKGRVTIQETSPRFAAAARLEAVLRVRNNTDRHLAEVRFECACGNGKKGFAKLGGGAMQNLKAHELGTALVACEGVPPGPKPEMSCIAPKIVECPAVRAR